MISDALSGVQSVQYCFTGSASAPSGGWQTAAESGGRYLFDYQSQNPDAETVYLHLKASDQAGNTLTWDSGAYTVQAAPDGSLTLTLSGAPTAWTSGDVTLEWRLTGRTGDTPYTLYGLPTAAETQTSDLSGSFAVNQNGLYTITVLDNRGTLCRKFGAGKPDRPAGPDGHRHFGALRLDQRRKDRHPPGPRR